MTSSPDNTVEGLLECLVIKGELSSDGFGWMEGEPEKHIKQVKQSLDSHYLSIFLELVGEDERPFYDDEAGFCDTCEAFLEDDTYKCYCDIINTVRAELRTALQDRLGEK